MAADGGSTGFKPDSPTAAPAILRFWNPASAAGRAALDARVTAQAQIIPYTDDFKFLLILTLLAFPLLPVFHNPAAAGPTPARMH